LEISLPVLSSTFTYILIGFIERDKVPEKVKQMLEDISHE